MSTHLCDVTALNSLRTTAAKVRKLSSWGACAAVNYFCCFIFKYFSFLFREQMSTFDFENFS